MSNRTPNGLTSKIKSFMGKNKQLFMGLVVGALIMLPTGLYVNELNNSRKVNTSATTQTEVKNRTPNETTPMPAEPTTEQTKPTPRQATPPPTAPKPYVASVCTKELIPRPAPITVVKDFMYKDSPQHYQVGRDGWRQTCTRNSDGYKPPDVVLQPLPDEIWVGGLERE